jgi:hypothetical protein
MLAKQGKKFCITSCTDIFILPRAEDQQRVSSKVGAALPAHSPIVKKSAGGHGWEESCESIRELKAVSGLWSSRLAVPRGLEAGL